MKFVITPEIVHEIYNQLNCGFRCYVHLETGEILSIPDDMQLGFSDIDAWREDINEIKKHSNKYLQIEPMHSSKSFRIMEAFAQQIPDEKVRGRLFTALNRKNPFRNFNIELGNHADLLDHWFKFKAEAYYVYVKNHLKSLTEEEE